MRYPVGDQLVTFGVDLAAPSQVAVEVAGGDVEVVDCSLQQFGRLDVACGRCCGRGGPARPGTPYPSLSDGARVFENVATYTARPVVSSR